MSASVGVAEDWSLEVVHCGRREVRRFFDERLARLAFTVAVQKRGALVELVNWTLGTPNVVARKQGGQ